MIVNGSIGQKLNNEIPSVLPEAGTYQLVGCIEDYRNNQAIKVI